MNQTKHSSDSPSRRRALGVACATCLVAVSLLTAPGRAATGTVGEWLGLAKPGDSPTVDDDRTRGGLHKEPASSVVLAAGRAPDGGQYEFVLESVAEPVSSDPAGEDVRRCLNIEWPDARTGRISPQFGCHPAFPPAVVDETVVKWQGAIFDPTYTSHVQIAGLASADVADVRILYKDEHGAGHDARVDFAAVTSTLAERAGADGPLGTFIAFLPPSWLGYGASFDPRSCPPKENGYDPDAIQVIAYDRQGKTIATRLGNNLLSTGGRPCQ